MDPPTGFSAPSAFIAWTVSHIAIDWYYFIELGAIMPLPKNNIKYGDVFLYNFGLGRNILGSSQGCILSWLLELNGLYDSHDNFNGCSIADSVAALSIWDLHYGFQRKSLFCKQALNLLCMKNSMDARAGKTIFCFFDRRMEI